MTNFDKAKSYREGINEKNGKNIKITWEEALKKFYLNNKYMRITKENEEIAELFGSKGLSQDAFDMASNLKEKAKDADVPEYILGKETKEETILESIERLKGQTEEEIIDGKKIIEELYNKQFTYEWLSKYDPNNYIIGIFCSCCATIISQFYGKNIAISSIMAEDVQNLVIRNSKGDIISKGTMYINKDMGYAVINDFELNRKYRNHEESPGVYKVEENSKEEQDRELIFKSFQRGLEQFIKEYDKQNPENPLKQINVGMGYNRLKKQVKRFKKATLNLEVPLEYKFQDARDEQYILYEKKQQNVEKKGEER